MPPLDRFEQSMNTQQSASASRERYRAFGTVLRNRFGGRVQRISIDAGFTCPNVDGAVAKGGCNFCDNRSFSPSRRVRLAAVADQLTRGISSVRKRYGKVGGFIAYFQPATNTYAPVDQLEEVYRLALSHSPEIVGLAIGTRPDCVPDSVLDLIDLLAAETYVSLEYGMQSRHDGTLEWMNRAHRHGHMVDAMNRSRGRRFETCAHVILGVPGESYDQMMHTARSIGPLGVGAVKIHNLYAVRDTPLGESVLRGEVKMMERGDYIRAVIDFLRLIPDHVVVERVSGDAPPDYLIEPRWCLEKASLRRDIEDEMARLDARQGDRNDPHWADSEVEPMSTPESISERIGQRGRLPVLKMGDAAKASG
jgi:radical SAM protein (TIGR01212 family)